MKKTILLLALCISAMVQAADEKVTALTELAAIADADLLYVVDDPGGTPISKKITVINLFDTIDTSAKLLTICTDETGTGVLVFGTAPTFTTEMTLTPVGTPTTDTDGEWAIDIDGWGTNFDAWEFFNSTASAYFVATTASDTPTNGQVPKWNTGGEITWENDDDSGGATAWSNIADPGNNGLTTITFDNAELSLLTGDNDAAASFFTIRNTDADHTVGNFYLLDLDYSADDGDVDADFIRLQDSGGDVLTIQQDGDLVSTGTLQGTVITATTSHIGPLLDAAGAEDMDYGSGDVTDHTFTTDGVGTAEIVLPAGSIDGTEILDDTITEPDLNATNTPGAGEDNYVLTYNHAGTNFTWAADATGGNTAWDDIGDPDANSVIDFGAFISQLDVNDFRIGAVDDGNYMLWTAGAVSFVGTGDIDLPADSVDNADINWGNITNLGEAGLITVADTADATSFVALWESATGDLAAKTDGAFTYNASTGVMTATGLTDGTATITGGALTGLTTALTVAQGGTGAASLTDGGVLFGSNTGALTAMSVLGDGAIVVGDGATDPVALTAFTSSTGDLIHEAGGLEADVSAYTGLLAISGGATSEVDALSELEAQIADVTAFVVEGTACSDIEGTGLAIAAGVLNWAAASTDLSDTAALLYETELDSESELETQIADMANIIQATEIDTFAELDALAADKDLVNKADGAVWLGNHDFGGADLEIPQASPATPDADGEIEFDFTDGSLVIQHGSAHAELGAATDVVVGKLIESWGGTIIKPDLVNDVWTVKAINSIEYPHGVVITAIYLGVSSDTTYVLTVQNFDDFDTINGANGTIDVVTYTADTTGEIIDTTPTYSTIAAGQLIMLSIPATDVDWIHFEIYFFEPAAG